MGQFNRSRGTSPVVARWGRHRSCVGMARRELGTALTAWGLGELEDSASLVLTELLSNAVRHARVSGRQIETRFVAQPDGLRIEVHDASPDPPEPRTPEPESCGGRGLILVDALADNWGVSERNGPGKIVWADLSLTSQANEGRSDGE